VVKWLIRLYPKAWRERYQDEFEVVVGEGNLRFRDVFDIIGGVMDAHIAGVKVMLARRKSRMNTKKLLGGVVLGAGVVAGAVAGLVSPNVDMSVSHRAGSLWSPSAAVAAPAFGVTGLRVQRCNCFPGSAIHHVNSGRPVVLALYYWVDRGAGKLRVSFTLTRNGRYFTGLVVRPSLPAERTLETEFPTPYRFRLAGHYKLVGRMSIDGETKVASARIIVGT